MRNKNHGAITIYLSIILSAVFMLSGVLMDIVRIKAAEVQLRRAANTAAASTLAGFDTKLKEDFGLFALHNSDIGYLKEDMKYYLTNQLITSKMNLDKEQQLIHYPNTIYEDHQFKQVSFINLYDYRLENIDVTPIYNFTENEITRQQIVEYMKYRGPAQLTENFLEKINYVADSKEATAAYKQKTIIEKKLGKIEKALIRLQEFINQLNKFEKESFTNTTNPSSQLMNLCESSVLSNIYNECSSADFGDLQTPEEEDEASRIIDRIEERYRKHEKQEEKSKDLLDNQLQTAKSAIGGALRELETIQNLSKAVEGDIAGFKSYLSELKNEKGKMDHSDVIAAMQKDIEKYKKLLDNDNSQSIAVGLTNNLVVINDLQEKMSDFINWIAEESAQISSKSRRSLEKSFLQGNGVDIIDQSQLDALMKKLAASSKINSIKDSAMGYETVGNILDKSKGSKGKDPRESTAEAAKKIRKEIQGSNPQKIENPMLLPSYYENGGFPNKIFSEDILNTENPYQDVAKVVEDFDVDFGDDSSFVNESFDYIIGFADQLKEKAINGGNEIYVNEYILKIFKDAVEIDSSNTDGKSSSTLFEKAEVEYILGGNAYEEINKYLVRGQILLIRFAMNTLHVYSDSPKRLQALEVATAVAGFTGFGIPIAHNLIMCAWGAAESFYDIEELYDGKKVAFIKNNSNWKTDLLSTGFAAKENVQAEGGIVDFDYHDYLRLLLLVKDKEVKMNRIEDLIQLNMQKNKSDFKLSGSNTYIKVNAQISIKYWFVTKLFIPSKYRTGDGSRHLINVEVWRGY